MTVPQTGEPSVSTWTVGEFEVLAVLDATGRFFLDRERAFPGATPQDWERARGLDPSAFGPDRAWLLDFRCFVVRGPGERVTVVDTGVGPADGPASAWAPVPGAFPERLRRAGVRLSDVDTVVLTHLHEDHCGWSVGRDGSPLFENARYVLQREEVSALSEADTAVEHVVRPLRAAGQLDELDGAALLSGGPSGGRIRAVPTPGHTPGHQSVVVDSRGSEVVVTGDVLVHAVQLGAADVAYRFEADPDRARRTRRDLLADARRTGAVLATAHLRQPFVTGGEPS